MLKDSKYWAFTNILPIKFNRISKVYFLLIYYIQVSNISVNWILYSEEHHYRIFVSLRHTSS